MKQTAKIQWERILCPQPPDWKLDWESEFADQDWVQPMIGCMQDPLHHAEGDVATHVRMVCEALVQNDEWRGLDESARATIFLAAALHDIAKPACTVQDASGRVTSADHGKRGAQMIRKLLWRGDKFIDSPPPLAVRECVSAMVRYSSLPFWFWDKDNPLRHLIRASQSVRLDWLAIMSQADALGRMCQDQAALLSRIQMFRDYATEHDCLTHPYAFSSGHSRFKYLRLQTMAEKPHDVFDETRFEVTMMSGLPGAGKDHWVSANARSLPVISLDEIRTKLGVDGDGDQGRVISRARGEAKALMRKEQSFIWNATNTTRFIRDPLVQFFYKYGGRIRIVYVEPPTYPELLGRNAKRQNPLPEKAIERLCDKLEVPDLTEAHEVLWITGSG